MLHTSPNLLGLASECCSLVLALVLVRRLERALVPPLEQALRSNMQQPLFQQLPTKWMGSVGQMGTLHHSSFPSLQ